MEYSERENHIHTTDITIDCYICPVLFLAIVINSYSA